jgi:hypothetical protein
MKTDSNTGNTIQGTTLGHLIERLSEFSQDTPIDSFKVVLLDKRGYPCTIELPKKIEQK